MEDDRQCATVATPRTMYDALFAHTSIRNTNARGDIIVFLLLLFFFLIGWLFWLFPPLWWRFLISFPSITFSFFPAVSFFRAMRYLFVYFDNSYNGILHYLHILMQKCKLMSVHLWHIHRIFLSRSAGKFYTSLLASASIRGENKPFRSNYHLIELSLLSSGFSKQSWTSTRRVGKGGREMV